MKVHSCWSCISFTMITYTAPTTSPIKYFYAPGWMSDTDIEAWKNEKIRTLRQNDNSYQNDRNE